MTTSTTTTTISQELFDEMVLENEDVFELEPDTACEETVQQLLKQFSCDESSLQHLCLHHPDSDIGRKERELQSTFVGYLTKLDDCIESDGSISIANSNHAGSTTDDAVLDALQNVGTMCTAAGSANYPFSERYLALFQQHSSIYTLMSFLGIEDSQKILEATMDTLVVVLNARVEFRDVFVAAWDRWNSIYLNNQDQVHDLKLKIRLVELAIAACKGCEANKVQWMKSKASIQTLLRDIKGEEQGLVVKSCRLLTVLCICDDLRPSNNDTPTVSSAHDHAVEFAKAGAIPILSNVLKESSSCSEVLTAASLTALRVLAIQNDSCQAIVATGILEWNWLDTEEVSVLIAGLGLLRNLCANDEIKTTLCNSTTFLPRICQCMATYPDVLFLQQHGCGIFAAMALRKPLNSQRIVAHDGHALIIKCMKTFPNSVALQRLGCLAIRNLSSRQQQQQQQLLFGSNTESIRDAMLELGTEQVLRDIAGIHQGSVDEAYAALKELGCEVQLLTLQQQGAPKPIETFGQVQSTFRPVFEPSDERTTRRG